MSLGRLVGSDCYLILSGTNTPGCAACCRGANHPCTCSFTRPPGRSSLTVPHLHENETIPHDFDLGQDFSFKARRITGARWRGIEEPDEASRGRPDRMEVDATAPRRRAPSPEQSTNGKGKGKARATSADLSQPEPEVDVQNEPEDGWNEEEIREARQRSLKQTRFGQADGWSQRGPFQRERTGFAGPSRTMYGHDDEPVARLGSQLGRDAHTSHSRTGNESSRPETRHPSVRAYLGNPPQPWASEGQRGSMRWRASGSRARSEFVPLPNTRAAEHLATRGAGRADSMQRSPMSRVFGLQCTPSPDASV